LPLAAVSLVEAKASLAISNEEGERSSSSTDGLYDGSGDISGLFSARFVTPDILSPPVIRTVQIVVPNELLPSPEIEPSASIPRSARCTWRSLIRASLASVATAGKALLPSAQA
jgi:hypothetical protein